MKDLKLEDYISENVREHIEQLEEDPREIEKKHSFMTQKHSKKDYAKMRELSVADILEAATVEAKTVKFEEDRMDRYQDMVKIEAKKKKKMLEK